MAHCLFPPPLSLFHCSFFCKWTHLYSVVRLIRLNSISTRGGLVKFSNRVDGDYSAEYYFRFFANTLSPHIFAFYDYIWLYTFYFAYMILDCLDLWKVLSKEGEDIESHRKLLIRIIQVDGIIKYSKWINTKLPRLFQLEDIFRNLGIIILFWRILIRRILNFREIVRFINNVFMNNRA